jgi:PIN domain nuclease of toxin-antitoxin system
MGGLTRLKLLLDTHVIFWSAAEPERFPQDIAMELENESNELWFSPISLRETLLLAEKQRIILEADHEKSIRKCYKNFLSGKLH